MKQSPEETKALAALDTVGGLAVHGFSTELDSATLDEITGIAGSEHVTTDDTVIPQVKVLQPMSEECKGKNAEFSQGQIFITGLGEGFDADETPIYAVPVMFMKTAVELPPKGAKDMTILHRYASLDEIRHLPYDAENYCWRNGENIVKESHSQIMLLLLPDGRAVPAVMYMKSTSLRSSKELNAKIQLRTVQGKQVVRWANVFRLKAKEKSNSMGTWYTPNFETELTPDGQLPIAPQRIRELAKQLYEHIQSGAVVTEQETIDPSVDLHAASQQVM